MKLNTMICLQGTIIRSKDYKIPLIPLTQQAYKIQLEYILSLEYIALIAAAIINCPFEILYESLSLCSVQKGEKKKRFLLECESKREVSEGHENVTLGVCL